MGMWPMDWEMDHDSLISAGSALQKLRMYPYFDVAHYLLMCESVRADLGASSLPFSRRHPFSCWLSSMLMCFAGGLLACFMLGEPVITPFRRHDDILLASLVWYGVFYSPFDIVHKLISFKLIKVVVSIAKEVQRTHKVLLTAININLPVTFVFHLKSAFSSNFLPYTYRILTKIGLRYKMDTIFVISTPKKTIGKI
ncbi:hypothetical protein Y032_0150g2756 [Ancylostoma ceylanicum]|uniref:Uncharacterized protein n=1 Tax=Ancylostoma ceylanicum TaxID=53326 RepID=A0A016T1H9_9BILA|nr:hypothetical protein Y032_0150g2756 [Ancylostoma ceylanicum]